MTKTYWCEHALVADQVEARVRLTVVDGRFSLIESGVDAGPHDERLKGFVLPGFANAHSHAFHRALRSRTQAGSGSFWTWREQMYRAATNLDPDSYHRLARATFAEMVCAGVTTVGEFHYLHHQPDGTAYRDPNAMGEAVLAAAADAGIRITLLDTVYLHGGLSARGHAPLDRFQQRFADASADAWIGRVGDLAISGSARLGAALHSVRAVDRDSAARVATWAGEKGCPLHVHLSEQVAENEQCLDHHGLTPTAVLAESGALNDSTTAIHATHLTDADIAALADSGATVALCPTTERDLADGIGPAAALSQAGVALALGSDSHAVIDMFEEARALELDERLGSGVRGSFSASELVLAATETGHSALGWTDGGRIRRGARADLVAVRLDSVRTAGSPADSVVMFAAGAEDVTDVFIDGTRVVGDGVHVTIDVPAELGSSIQEVMSP